MAQHYGPLFDAARQWAEAKKKDAQLKDHEDPQVMAAHAALFDTSGFLTVPAKVAFAFDEKTLANTKPLAEEARVLESSRPDLPSAMSVTENTVATTIRFTSVAAIATWANDRAWFSESHAANIG